MDDKDKHKVQLELHTLHEVPIHPPRRKFWDLVPEWLGMLLIKRGYNPKPTPYELWAIRSAALRVYYKRFYGAVAVLNYHAAADSLAAFLPSSPGSSELN